MLTDSPIAGEAAAIVRQQTPALPERERKRELTPKQLAELRRTMPAFKELEARTLRSRGVNVWWAA